MKVIKTVASLRRTLSTYNKTGKKIGLVPTMGALHDGHMSLVDQSVREADVTIVSIFINPIQFGKNEDLDKYPRRLEADAELALKHGADFIFAPSASEMYPSANSSTMIRNEELEGLYCGATRPGHFRGVLTVVAKLLLITGADTAYFGVKDYQQVFLIEKMVADLNFKTKIIRVPIFRDASGLAVSSRNEYLTPEERNDNAPALYEGLLAAKKAYDAGERSVAKLRDLVIRNILIRRGVVQFVEVADSITLQKCAGFLTQEKPVILVAAFLGKTRLIDNIEL